MSNEAKKVEATKTVMGLLNLLEPWFKKGNWQSHTVFLDIEIGDKLREMLPVMTELAFTLVETRARQSASGENAGLRAELKKLRAELAALGGQPTHGY